MARIRTLKPEFWDSPSTARADLAVRLTFMAMWNWADDSGHGTANLKELEAFCWPNDDIRDLPRASSAGSSGNSAPVWRNFAEVCGEVAEVYGVVFYRVEGRPYYEIPNFKKHQSKDYRATSKYPMPAEGEIYDVTSGNVIVGPGGADVETLPESASSGNSATPCGKSAIGTGEQGNRGTGEQGREAAQARPARKRATRLPEGWMPDRDVIEAMRTECPYVDLEAEHRKFADYWAAQPGQKGVKADWNATWRNWVRRAGENVPARAPGRPAAARSWFDLATTPPAGSQPVLDATVVEIGDRQ